MKRFERVVAILEEAVEGTTIGAHRNFWRGLTLEEFKLKRVFGKVLITVGNAEESNLVKSLEGRAPFGADMGTPGAIYNRMPDGFPPVSVEKIAYIRQWINDGCPDQEEPPAVDAALHNSYWRSFDDWAMYNAAPETETTIGDFFNYVPLWMNFARDGSLLPAWETAISTDPGKSAVDYLSPRILETIYEFYGTPSNPDKLLEGYELFGADKLPDDPLRPQDPRHNMNGAIMWFFYAAFVDARLRSNVSNSEREEWNKMGRAVLIGLLNDGVFRRRFPVKGFASDEAGASAIRTFVRALPNEEIPAELARRLVDSELGFAKREMDVLGLLTVPPEEHDLTWLKQALQWAVQLELTTIPPYLCAWWSIKKDNSGGYISDSLRTIVLEEMIHMGLACNMMTTLGAAPKIKDAAVVPKYPGELPGGVKPNFEVALRAYSNDQLQAFMEIEKPEHTPIGLTFKHTSETFDTIGIFYDAIQAAFDKLPATALTGQRQLTIGGFGGFDDLIEIKTHADVKTAIDKIKNQGEGTTQTPEDTVTSDSSDLAHFYRFREMYRGYKFRKNAAGQWMDDHMQPLAPPDVFPMADIPAGGYAQSKDFDRLYSELLRLLHKAWETGSGAELDNAVNLMFDLTDQAQTLMKTRINGTGPDISTFGPSFLLVE